MIGMGVLPSESCASTGETLQMSSTKSGQMNALRKMQGGPGLSFESAVVPAIGPTDVLVRVTGREYLNVENYVDDEPTRTKFAAW